VLVLSSNVVGVGEERLWLRDCSGADFDDVCCAWSGVFSRAGVSSRAVLVLSSNVVGVGEERLLLRNGGGADFQVFIVLMVRDALWGIKPPAKTSQIRLPLSGGGFG
jgi:hypothetical protein